MNNGGTEFQRQKTFPNRIWERTAYSCHAVTRSAILCGSMRSRYYARESAERAYFVTSTIVNWLPVFAVSPTCRDLLVQSFEYCQREKGLQLYAWVMMENHFHAIVYSPRMELSRVMADLKKFTARRMLAALEAEGQEWLFSLLAEGKAAHKRGSRAQLWQEGYHPQAVYTDAVMFQKLEYLHHNPVRRGWVASPEHWRYSSAHEWLPGAIPLLRCDVWR